MLFLGFLLLSDFNVAVIEKIAEENEVREVNCNSKKAIKSVCVTGNATRIQPEGPQNHPKSSHKLSQLKHSDTLGYGRWHANASGLDNVVGVHDGMDCIVHGTVPVCWC